jgi:ABC-2 type transport system ATP-binding protein
VEPESTIADVRESIDSREVDHVESDSGRNIEASVESPENPLSVDHFLDRFDALIERLKAESEASASALESQPNSDVVAPVVRSDELVVVEKPKPSVPDAVSRPARAIPAAAETRSPVKPKTPARSKTQPAVRPAPARSPRVKSEPPPATPPAKPKPAPRPRPTGKTLVSLQGLSKDFGGAVAVDSIDLDVPAGSIFGIVGPNGAGKTTTLGMISGMLRPSAGRITIAEADVWKDTAIAKRHMGILPDRMRVFDRLTGRQLLHYSGVLRGLEPSVVRQRTADLAAAFGIEEALTRLVADYSAGMAKKVALAAAMIHSPKLLVLDEPFEAVDPVSAERISHVLRRFVSAGGTVILSSHSMELIENLCDSVAVIVEGKVIESGSIEEVRGSVTLEERFVELAIGADAAEGLEWLHTLSD